MERKKNGDYFLVNKTRRHTHDYKLYTRQLSEITRDKITDDCQ